MKTKKIIFSLIITIFLTNLSAHSAMQGISREQAMQLLAQYQDQPQVAFTNPQKLPSLVVYTTSWCGYCKQISPSIDKLEKEFKGKIFIKRVNVESATEKAFVKSNKTGSNGVPHIQIYGADGKLLRSQIGYQDYERLKTEVKLFI